MSNHANCAFIFDLGHHRAGERCGEPVKPDILFPYCDKHGYCGKRISNQENDRRRRMPSIFGHANAHLTSIFLARAKVKDAGIELQLARIRKEMTANNRNRSIKRLKNAVIRENERLSDQEGHETIELLEATDVAFRSQRSFREACARLRYATRRLKDSRLILRTLEEIL